MDVTMPARMLRLLTAGTRIAHVLALVMPFAAHAGTTLVFPPQPVSPYADTEVSTNLPVRVSDEDSRGMELQFALDGCVSNSVQVAFGRDSNGDGVLGVDETETLYGWRNGRYFVESMTEGVRIEEADLSGEPSCAFVMSLHLSKGRGFLGNERAWHRHPDERFGVGAELAVPARLEHDARDASRSRHPGGMVRLRRPFAVLLHDLQVIT